MAKPRGLRSGPLPDPRHSRHKAALPVDRMPPFLVAEVDGSDLVLIAPFRKRKSGPSHEEVALVRAVAARLAAHPPAGPCWIDPRDGSMTPAAIGAGQLRRRLIDDVSFDFLGGIGGQKGNLPY